MEAFLKNEGFLSTKGFEKDTASVDLQYRAVTQTRKQEWTKQGCILIVKCC